MFAPFPALRQQLNAMLRDKEEQGRDVTGMAGRLERLPDDYQALAGLAAEIDAAPVRADWQYVEPSDLAGIRAEQDPSARLLPEASGAVCAETAGQRARAGFLGSVAGCVLGKPVEVMPTLDELRSALERLGEWPLRDYIPSGLCTAGGFRAFHPDWPGTTRENITQVVPDDDINYTLLGVMTLERYGPGFTKANLRSMWLENIPFAFTWGPERTFLTRQGLAMGLDDYPTMTPEELEALPARLNPGDEACGAMIRADAYGYACPGRPDLAAELAWRDASLTHRGNGIYGAMFAAAAIAAAFTATDPLDVFATALRYVPQRSRFFAIVSDSLGLVAQAHDWLEGYRAIHGRYAQYGHCRVFQESGTLINTLRFASDVGDGICKQVSQGNDTDSYGATAGSLLGVYFGPGYLEERWTAPFNDVLHTRLAGWYENSLSAAADRVAALPARVLGAAGATPPGRP
ncbi:ADP-ribosylglycohydrolase family protein [Streptomyces sp. NPDC049954]|uniref:ADP-ribosylglycohydrolase family protein n=1 Tax=Streptomyces sp. NPDC049954 TaxID=3155779 RepID=UPI003439FCFA